LRETLLPWLNNTFDSNAYTYLAHESMVTPFNGSEIWIGGLEAGGQDFGGINTTRFILTRLHS
jgi:hypothetical protein